ncbi:MAG TPA: peptidoglycan amidohydrolase family protein [bacterium]|nr:peptidoglycan amidohydrolase family protein [bacterium]
MKILHRDNYLSAIINAVFSTQYRNLWVIDNEIKIDILQDGKLSCAVFVSSILKLFGLIDEQRATVESAVIAMIKYGWQEIDVNDIQPGDVIVWNKRTGKDGETHGHIGFYVGEEKAISNSVKLRKIVQHGWDYGGRRKIEKVLRWNWE